MAKQEVVLIAYYNQSRISQYDDGFVVESAGLVSSQEEAVETIKRAIKIVSEKGGKFCKVGSVYLDGVCDSELMKRKREALLHAVQKTKFEQENS